MDTTPSPLPEHRAGLECVTVEIHGIAVYGVAVGKVVGPPGSSRIGMTAFVPFVAPGDTIQMWVTKAHARYLEGAVADFVTSSPHTVAPECPYFEDCGGCDLQHIAYPRQLQAKEEMIRGAFRSGGLTGSISKIEPVVPGPPYGYRRRVTLHVDSSGSLGYYQRNSHRLLPVQTCPISLPVIDRFLAANVSFADLVPSTPFDREWRMTLHLDAGESGLFAVLKTTRLPRSSKAEAFLERLQPHCVGGSLEVAGHTVASFGESVPLSRLTEYSAVSAGDPTENLRPLESDANVLAAGEFAQVNPFINARLVEKVRQLARDAGAKVAFDLYAGSGNFALPLAADGLTVVAVEAVPALVQAGQREAERLGVSGRVTFAASTVEKFLHRKKPAVDLVIADPPRAGLKETALILPRAAHLLLISCHLPSAVRDVRNLVGEGWKVEAIYPFDMFAQTAYVELLTYLRR